MRELDLAQQTLLADESATEEAGQQLSQRLAAAGLLSGAVVLLYGDLGAGKTTFSRGFLRGLGYLGRVKSPTYTLIERYTTSLAECCHLDLYRLSDPEELEYIGFRDLLEAGVVLLVEWPQRGEGLESIATVTVTIEYHKFEGQLARQLTMLPAG